MDRSTKEEIVYRVVALNAKGKLVDEREKSLRKRLSEIDEADLDTFIENVKYLDTRTLRSFCQEFLDCCWRESLKEMGHSSQRKGSLNLQSIGSNKKRLERYADKMLEGEGFGSLVDSWGQEHENRYFAPTYRMRKKRK